MLIALVVADHTHHEAAEEWLASRPEPFATCPITEGALLRLLMRSGVTATEAVGVVVGVTSDDRHRFWPDSVSYAQVAMTGVFGHRQVTDAYLAALAASNGGRLATFDQALSALHPDVVTLVLAAGGGPGSP